MVGKGGKVNLFVVGVVLALVIFSLYFVLASHTVTLTDGQSWFKPAEDVSYVFNLTISNTDTDLATGNITQVNITLPATFTFYNNTGTNATETASFTNTSSMLMWINNTGLIANVTTVFFWFNVSASTPGNFSINVSTKNSTSIMNTSLTVVVNDTTAPATIDFVSPTPATRSNLSQSFLAINLTATDNGVISQILLRLYNSTHQIINTTTSSTSPLFSNITSLSDGVYYINATVNDTYNNQNSTTSTLNITLDTTNPLADYGLVTEANNTNKSQSWVYVNVSVTETNEANITFTLYNSTSSVNITNSTAGTRTINWTGLSDGSYRYNVTVRDYASNSNSTSTRAITLDTTNPLIVFGASGNADNDSSADRDWIYVNVTVTETNERNTTFYLYNSTSSVNITNFTAGTRTINWTGLARTFYFYNVTVRDYSSNSNTTITRKITLSSPVATTTPAPSGGGGSSPSGVASTYDVSPGQFKQGYSRDVFTNSRFRISINKEYHFVKLTGVSVSTATIEVSSTPQTAVFSVGESKKFEVSGDNFYDILVTLNSLSSNHANIGIKSIYEEIPKQVIEEEPEKEAEERPTITGEATEGAEGGKNLNWLWGILVIVIILIIWFIIYKSSKKARR